MPHKDDPNKPLPHPSRWKKVTPERIQRLKAGEATQPMHPRMARRLTELLRRMGFNVKEPNPEPPATPLGLPAPKDEPDSKSDSSH